MIKGYEILTNDELASYLDNKVPLMQLEEQFFTYQEESNLEMLASFKLLDVDPNTDLYSLNCNSDAT